MLKIRPLNEDVYYGAFGPIYPNDYSFFGGRTLYDVALKNLGKGANPEKLKEEYDKGYQTGHIQGLKKGFLAPDIAVFEGENIEPTMLTDKVSDLKKNEKIAEMARKIKLNEVEEDLKRTNDYLQKNTRKSIDLEYKKKLRIANDRFNKKKATPESMNTNPAVWKDINTNLNAQKRAKVIELNRKKGQRTHLSNNLQELEGGGAVDIGGTISRNLVEAPMFHKGTNTFRGTTMTITDDVAVINRESIRFMKKNDIDPLTKVLDLRTNPIPKEELLGGSYSFEDLMAPPSLITKGRKIYEVQDADDGKGKDLPLFGKKLKEPKIQPEVSQTISPPTPPSTGLTTNVKSARKGKQPQRKNFTPITEFLEPGSTNNGSVSLNTFYENKNESSNVNQPVITTTQSQNQPVLTNEQSELMTKLHDLYPGKSDDDMLNEILNKKPTKTKLTKLRKIFPGTDDVGIVNKVTDLKQKMENISTINLPMPASAPVPVPAPAPAPAVMPGPPPMRGGPPPPPMRGGEAPNLKLGGWKKKTFYDEIKEKPFNEITRELNDLLTFDSAASSWVYNKDENQIGSIGSKYDEKFADYLKAYRNYKLNTPEVINIDDKIANIKQKLIDLENEDEGETISKRKEQESKKNKYDQKIKLLELSKNKLIKDTQYKKYEADFENTKSELKKVKEKELKNLLASKIIEPTHEENVNQISNKISILSSLPSLNVQQDMQKKALWLQIEEMLKENPEDSKKLTNEYNKAFKEHKGRDLVEVFKESSTKQQDQLINNAIKDYKKSPFTKQKEIHDLLFKYVNTKPESDKAEYIKYINDSIDPIISFTKKNKQAKERAIIDLIREAESSTEIYLMNEIHNLLQKYLNILPKESRQEFESKVNNIITPVPVFTKLDATRKDQTINNLVNQIKSVESNGKPENENETQILKLVRTFDEYISQVKNDEQKKTLKNLIQKYAKKYGILNLTNVLYGTRDVGRGPLIYVL